MVKLEDLDVAFTAVHALTFVTKNDMDFHPLWDVAVVTNPDARSFSLHRALLGRLKRAPREVMLLLQAQHGTVHMLHQTVDARVRKLPPPLFLDIVARLGFRTFRSNILRRCRATCQPEVATVQPDRKQPVAHPRHANLLGDTHGLSKPPLPSEQNPPPNLPTVHPHRGDPLAGVQRPVLECQAAHVWFSGRHHRPPP